MTEVDASESVLPLFICAYLIGSMVRPSHPAQIPTGDMRWGWEVPLSRIAAMQHTTAMIIMKAPRYRRAIATR